MSDSDSSRCSRADFSPLSSFPHPTFATASSLLLRTFISILSLYRAIVPIQHATALSTVPSIGVQFANDTDWIGEAVEAVWRKSKSGQSSELDLDVEQALKMTKKMGKDWRERQIVRLLVFLSRSSS